MGPSEMHRSPTSGVLHMEQFSMPYYHYGLCLFLALLVPTVVRAVFPGARKQGPRLPSGPWQLPVIGSLHHLLRGLPHRTMRDLSLRHGPLMLLRVCEREMIVVSSAEALREIHKDHDAAFSERPSSPCLDELSRYGQGIIFAPYGDHWRLLRRILTTELLTARRVETFRSIREDEAARLVSSVRTRSSANGGGQLVNIDELIGEFVNNAAGRAIFGDRLPESAAFMEMVRRGVDLSSHVELRDLFPSSRFVRLLPRKGGKAERHRREMFRLMDDILRTHENTRAAGDGSKQSMVEVLQRIQKEDSTRVSLTNGAIRAVLTDVYGAGLETTMTTLEWAMSELMKNPSVMRKARSETRRVLSVGLQERINEDAITGLHYIGAVIKETLRLHPPSPFVPRLCLQDSKIQGYDIPRGVITLANVWAISRDPECWEEPDKFLPERFQGENAYDFKGADFEFTPFGAGRRMCPGINFTHKNAEIALASLLYHFDWELPSEFSRRMLTWRRSLDLLFEGRHHCFFIPVPRFDPL